MVQQFRKYTELAEDPRLVPPPDTITYNSNFFIIKALLHGHIRPPSLNPDSQFPNRASVRPHSVHLSVGTRTLWLRG